MFSEKQIFVFDTEKIPLKSDHHCLSILRPKGYLSQIPLDLNNDATQVLEISPLDSVSCDSVSWDHLTD